MEHLYTAKATAIGGRNGKVFSDDGVIALDMRMPKELGGPGGEATNPEQLFAAGYAACFEGALNAVARKKNIKLEGTEVTAYVSLGKDESDGGFQLGAKLEAKITGVEYDVAVELIQAAHHFCPYSKALKGNVDVKLFVIK